jgi:hypothetical protein
MNEQVEMILTALRDRKLGLGWIADEIVNSIQLGKPSEKFFNEPGQKRRKKGQYTEPLSSEEEMETALNVIRNYFVEPNQLWKSAEATASEALLAASGKRPTSGWQPNGPAGTASKPLTFQIVDVEKSQPVTMFAADIAPSIQKLSRLLEAALQEEKAKNIK